MSNFQCPHCGFTNIDCGKEGYKTPKEIELEEKIESTKKVLESECPCCYASMTGIAHFPECKNNACSVYVALRVLEGEG